MEQCGIKSLKIDMINMNSIDNNVDTRVLALKILEKSGSEEWPRKLSLQGLFFLFLVVICPPLELSERLYYPAWAHKVKTSNIPRNTVII